MKNINSARQTKAKVTKHTDGRVVISNIFAGQRTKGLEPNEKGWFKLYGGAFNVNNHQGDFYPLSPGLKKELTEEKSAFNYRMANGVLGGECNHPNLHLLPTKAAQMMRLNQIDKTRECLQVMQIELDTTTYKNPDGSPVTAIWVWVKPTGVNGAAFEKALKDPDIQVALSIRTESVNRLRPNMTYERVATKIIGFDWVDIQGVPNATKFESYSMESMFVIEEETVTVEDVYQIENNLNMQGVSMEDAGAMLDNLKAVLSANTTIESTDRTFDF